MTDDQESGAAGRGRGASGTEEGLAAAQGREGGMMVLVKVMEMMRVMVKVVVLKLGGAALVVVLPAYGGGRGRLKVVEG